MWKAPVSWLQHSLVLMALFGSSSASPQFKPEEIASIVKDFDEPGFLAPIGLHGGGTKYMVIQGEPGVVISGKGVTVKKTGQALIFGIYEEPMTPRQCNMVVEKMGDYLIDLGLSFDLYNYFAVSDFCEHCNNRLW